MKCYPPWLTPCYFNGHYIFVCDSKKSNEISQKQITLFPKFQKGESVMEKRNFTQKQKIAILKGAKKTTVRYAAKVAGIHDTTVYDWRRQFEAMGKEAFLVYQVSKPGRGLKQISPEKEQAVLKEWENNSGYVWRLKTFF